MRNRIEFEILAELLPIVKQFVVDVCTPICGDAFVVTFRHSDYPGSKRMITILHNNEDIVLDIAARYPWFTEKVAKYSNPWSYLNQEAYKLWQDDAPRREYLAQGDESWGGSHSEGMWSAD
jgi:hypothetical protein